MSRVFFAIAKTGAIAVPINWRLVPDELAFILKDSGATVLIFGAQFAEAAQDLHARGADGTDLRDWIVVGASESPLDFAHDYAALTGEASDAEPDIGACDDDDLYIMYTSGTTGLPKGAVHSHNTAIWACLTINVTADGRHADRSIIALPLFHVGALTPMTANVQRGVTSIVMRTFDPTACWKIIEEEKINSMLAVPAMLNFMLQTPVYKKTDYSRLRWIMSGAAPVPVTLIHAYAELKIDIHQVYGLTESCGPACLTSPEDALRKAGSTGKPFFHTDVRVIRDDGADVTGDEVGEVIIRGAHLMKGLLEQSESHGRNDSRRLASFRRRGHGRFRGICLHSGPQERHDYLRWREHLSCRDRRRHPQTSRRTRSGGHRTEEREVGGVTAGKSWQRVTKSSVRTDILEHCKGKVAPFKMPTGVEFVDVIPRNPAGKILKRVLREQFPDEASA